MPRVRSFLSNLQLDFFSLVGKYLCVWLIYKYAEVLIDHWEVLLVLLAWLIAPEVVRKLLTLRFNSGDTNDYKKETWSSHQIEGNMDIKNKDSVQDLSKQ